MKTRDDLHDLICQMDASEKGYFRKFSRLYSQHSGGNYLTLFDILNGMEVYDEERLKKKLKDEKLVRQLGPLKAYLYDLLLKTLRAYRQNHSVHAQINSLVENAEILFSKGLYDQAMKALVKCRELVKAVDVPFRELEIQHWEQKFITENKTSGMDVLLEASVNESLSCVEHLRKQIELRGIYYKMLYLVKQNMRLADGAEQEMKRLFALPILQDAEALEGFYQKLNFHNNWNIYHFLSGRREEAYLSMQRVIELWEAHPRILENNIDIYIAGVNNYLIACISLKKTDEIRTMLEKTSCLQITGEGLKARIFENMVFWRLNYCYATSNWDDLEDITKEIQENLEKYGSKITEPKRISMLYSMGVYYFCNGDFHKALVYINELMNMRKTSVRKDVQVNTRIVNCLLHYELGNEEILEYAVRSAQRFMESREQYYAYEKIVVTSIHKLVRSHEHERPGIFRELYRQLQEYFLEFPDQQTLVNLFDIFSWVEAHADNKSFRETVRLNYYNRYQSQES